jgi:ubiquinone/menaquinone biosynthesis C-methylase UbiE
VSKGDAALSDDLAASYDDWYRTPLGALADELEREAISALVGEVHGQTALDASCGTGNYTLDLAGRGARVTAMDASAPMLALAQAKARQEEGLSLALVRASLERLPFCAGSLGVVTCVLALEFVADPARAVAELARVQPPGGRLGWISLQLAAQVVEVHVDGALDAVIDAQVGSLQELHRSEHLSRVRDKDLQQAELGGGKRDDLAVHYTLLSRHVKDNIPEAVGTG